MQVTFIFFLGRVSLFFGPRPIQYSNPYVFTLLLFAGARTPPIVLPVRTGAHLSSLQHCLRGRPTCSPEGRTHFFATRYVRWHHFIPPLMPILYSRTSEDATLCPLFGWGFISGFSFPLLFATRYVRWCHITLQRETTTTGLESFPSLYARYMGVFFYPGFPSCGRAGPGVESGTFGLEIRCSTTEPFQPPFFGQHMLPCVFTGLDMI